MQELVVPPVVPLSTKGNLSDLTARNAQRFPHRAVFSVRRGAAWEDVTAVEFAAAVDGLAKGLMAAGVQPGDRVALFSRTRYEWTLADFAIWTAGGVTVPIYETSSAEQCWWILSDSGAVAVIVENRTLASTVAQVHDRLPELRDVWQIETGGLDELTRTGREVADELLAARRGVASRNDVATIIYTSGTTGRPKGCRLTHGNFMSLAENAVASVPEVFDQQVVSTLLFLPLAHVFARLIQILCVHSAATMAHSPDIKNLLDDLADFRPTFVLAVPRVFEKIYNAAEQKALSGGGLQGRVFSAAAASAIRYSQALGAGAPGPRLRAEHAVFDRLVYGKLRDAMGGRVSYAVSGGAPLGERLGHFFRGVGVTILEGYGLTETTAPATVNLPSTIKIGTVGRPLPAVGVRIADDGEICLSGVNLFAGYHNNPEASAEAIKDGWFSTGDLGELDTDGFLRITGRKKEILVTAAGKNVAPAVLEDRLRAHPLVSQCIVVGDRRPFIAALVTIDEEMYPLWAANRGLTDVSLDAARSHPDVIAELQKAVDDANLAVSKAESIRAFDVLPHDLTIESGHLTPSLKLKRHIVMEDYEAQIELLYTRGRGG
ncbi:MAG: AMP-dependent synthetase/ligase [Dermatophilaceae bacterium]